MTYKKRICFLKDLISAPTNGAEINVYRLVHRLNADGFEASIQSFDPLTRPEYLLNYLKNSRSPILELSPERLVYQMQGIPIVLDRRVAFDRSDLAHTDAIKSHMLSCLDEIKPDALICTQTDYVAVEAALESGLPLITLLTDNEFIRPEKIATHPHGAKIEALIRAPQTYSALSKFLVESFKGIWGPKAQLLYGLIPPEKYVISGLPRPPQGQIFGMVNTSAHKGFPLMALLAAAYPHTSFSSLVNAPPSPQQAQAFAQVKKEFPNLGFEGPYGDPREFYRKLRALLVPSVWEEGFGRVAMEAGLNGIPVLASNRGGLPEALNGGGFLIEAPFVDSTGQVEPQELIERNRGWFNAFEQLKDPQRYMLESEKMREASFGMVQKIEESYQEFCVFLESL